MSGLPKNRQEPCLAPPMPWMRDLIKSKGLAPLAVPVEMPLGSYKNPNLAFTWWLQKGK